MGKHSERFVQLVDEAKEQIEEISIEETLQQLEEGEIVLIDVREDNEWEGGHIPGAIHIGKGVIERDIEQQVPDLNQPLVLYCGGGYRSALAADNLKRMGYVNAKSMIGGWREYQAQNSK